MHFAMPSNSALSKTFRGFQKLSEVFRYFQSFSEALRGFQKLSEVFRDFTFCVRMLLAYVFKAHFERILKSQSVQKFVAVAQNLVFVLSEHVQLAGLVLGLIWE